MPSKRGHRSSNEQFPLRNVRLSIERHIRENAQDLPCAERGFSWSRFTPSGFCRSLGSPGMPAIPGSQSSSFLLTRLYAPSSDCQTCLRGINQPSGDIRLALENSADVAADVTNRFGPVRGNSRGGVASFFANTMSDPLVLRPSGLPRPLALTSEARRRNATRAVGIVGTGPPGRYGAFDKVRD
jgi:hypothetical protein